MTEERIVKCKANSILKKYEKVGAVNFFMGVPIVVSDLIEFKDIFLINKFRQRSNSIFQCTLIKSDSRSTEGFFEELAKLIHVMEYDSLGNHKSIISISSFRLKAMELYVKQKI